MAKAKNPIGLGSVLSTVSAPASHEVPKAPENISKDLVTKVASANDLAAQTPFNEGKTHEYGEPAGCPFAGLTRSADSHIATASTVSETNASDKTGSGTPPESANYAGGNLDRV